jgi:hypothetical protein
LVGAALNEEPEQTAVALIADAIKGRGFTVTIEVNALEQPLLITVTL